MNAVVLNDNLSTLGGGERLTLAYALALQTLGYEVRVVSRMEIPDSRAWKNVFGPEFDSLTLTHVPRADFTDWVTALKPEVFVNNSHQDTTPNPARVGIYSQMFPCRPYRLRTEGEACRNLDSYDVFACLTDFVKVHTRELWDVNPEKLAVLLPPIGGEFIERSRGNSRRKKKKSFLNVGRFNPQGHNKNQKILIEEFLNACRESPELEEWDFHFVGTVNAAHGGDRYYETCRKLAEGAAVHFHPDLAFSDMVRLMEESFGYIHGTGAFLPPGQNPEFCEHYGLTILEAMACGCIPLVYGRGGIFDVLDPFRGGIPYMTPDGLRQGYKVLAQLHATDYAGLMAEYNFKSLNKVSHSCFTNQIANFIKTYRKA